MRTPFYMTLAALCAIGYAGEPAHAQSLPTPSSWPTMKGLVTAVLLTLGILPGIVRAQQSQPAGCYVAEIGDWSPPRPAGNEAHQSPPEQFVLKDSTGSSHFERGRKIIRPVIPVGGGTPNAFWEQIGSDSVQVVWTNGFAGVRMRLAIEGDVLRGTATAFTDVRWEGMELPTAVVEARRVECGEREGGGGGAGDLGGGRGAG